MKRKSQLLTGLSVFAITLLVFMPCQVDAHGGIGGFHAGAVHVGGVHVGGIHAGGFNAVGFHAGGVHVGGVGVGHVGYYPHYHPGVGYYHPVARAAAWNAAYNGAYGYGGYNPYPYQGGGSSIGVAMPGDGDPTGVNPEDAQRTANAKQQLDAELNADKDKDQ